MLVSLSASLRSPLDLSPDADRLPPYTTVSASARRSSATIVLASNIGIFGEFSEILIDNRISRILGRY
jgi:hypothetical protein